MSDKCQQNPVESASVKRRGLQCVVCVAIACSGATVTTVWNASGQVKGIGAGIKNSAPLAQAPINGLPDGKPMVWQDRGELTPSKVYWGVGSTFPDPTSRRPSPPLSGFEKETGEHARSPK